MRVLVCGQSQNLFNICRAKVGFFKVKFRSSSNDLSIMKNSDV